MTVAYGANGHYAYGTFTDGTACNNKIFGDPIPNTVKACYALPTAPGGAWKQCAPENGTCTVAGTMTVAYGANDHFAYGTFPNGTACNNTIFGDPNPNTVKACYATLPPS
jgi:hypothetical protein